MSGLTGVVEIAAGVVHTCAVTASAQVLCWGHNGPGTLGDGTTTDRLVPTPVAAMWRDGLGTGGAAIAAGGYHTCSVSAGGVLCWGMNTSGQLGDGTTTDRTVPAPVTGLDSGIAAVATGAFHSCAIAMAGAVFCWGSNSVGQLGFASSQDQRTPALVTALGTGTATIAAGHYHTCALSKRGEVTCWGYNGDGQLGDGTTATRWTPTPVPGLQGGVASIAAAGWHTCALRDDGSVVCWGANWDGQLGDGGALNRENPGVVVGLETGVAAIAAGESHTCALKTDGSVVCWGANHSGQLGDGSTLTRTTPVRVDGLQSGVAQVAAGAAHTCARLSDGGAVCWGSNESGQLGDGTQAPRLLPTPVSGLGDGLAEISAGYAHTCALTTTDGVRCWGENTYGQLGDGTTTLRTVPTGLRELGSAATPITMGSFHACALTPAAGVVCWGRNTYGELGDGTTTDRAIPVPVSGLPSGVAAVAAGGEHTCALTTGGAAWCWGHNNVGQLGDGSTLDRVHPGEVSFLGSGVVSLAAGELHTCALKTDGSVVCWGLNMFGQLGNGTTESQAAPGPVIGLSSGIAAITAGTYHTCALTLTGAVWCWGFNAFGQLGTGTTGQMPVVAPEPVIGLQGGASAIAAGDSHTCALMLSGTVMCWGANAAGQLGTWTPAVQPVPVTVSGGLNGVEAISAGWAHTCATTSGGGLACWGDNTFGQLGDGEASGMMMTPTPVRGLGSGIQAIASGGRQSCAMLAGGAMVCWGANDFGQLGDGTTAGRALPVLVRTIGSGGARIAAGDRHMCALTPEGGVVCWGHNGYGQIGDGTSFNRRGAPTPVLGLASGVTAIAAGSDHTCALTASGGVLCWGANEGGQLGDGGTTSQPAPTPVSGLTTGVVAIAAGDRHTCAVTTDGAVRCWGDNRRGQLGDGTTSGRRLPTPVSGLGGGVVAIAARGNHTCALTAGGAVRCWGSNWYGEAGTASKSDELLPTEVFPLDEPAVGIAAGDRHTCVLTASGSVLCWGDDASGQLGNGTIGFWPVLEAMGALERGAVAIAAGSDYTCALSAGGGVLCWGANYYGQLGDGTTMERQVPTPVSGLTGGVAGIAAGSGRTCALTTAGNILCWGSNDSDALGLGDSVFDISTPVPVRGAAPVTAVGVGVLHTCAVTAEGAVVCWGNNASGELGDGTTVARQAADAGDGPRHQQDSGRSGRRQSHMCADDERRREVLGLEPLWRTGGRDDDEPLGTRVGGGS